MYQPKVFLIVLDGWGYSEIKEGNAIALAHLPHFQYLWQHYPHALIEASGEAVGLPWGNIGSSEVGHSSLGSGRIINQDLPRISKAISSGQFFRNPVLLETLNYARKNHCRLHFIGLVSAGGVHSHINHLFALLMLLKRSHFFQPSFIQMFTDGRDTPTKSALLYVNKLNTQIKALGLATRIASVIGRYWAMDRDSHWDRTFAAYDLMVLGRGETANSPREAILKAYVRGETDEFIKPTAILGQDSRKGIFDRLFAKDTSQLEMIGQIKDKDALIFFNFRSERVRQLVETFMLPSSNYPDKKLLSNLYVTSLVEYEKSLPIHVALPPEKIENPLAKMISAQNLNQLHVTETEKYAHATYFFDGGKATPFKNEEWVTIPSPKVATYDLAPEMSAAKITDTIFKKTQKKQYEFVMINFANADMVGHTGNLSAAIQAVEAVDKELGRLVAQFPETVFLITADHGNAERMINPENGQIETEHSISPVPFILVGPQFKKEIPELNQVKPVGILADIAPTILDILNIEPPPEMTGCSLLDTLL